MRPPPVHTPAHDPSAVPLRRMRFNFPVLQYPCPQRPLRCLFAQDVLSAPPTNAGNRTIGLGNHAAILLNAPAGEV